MQDLIPYLIFTMIGYLSGSVMYSKLLPSLFKHVDITKISDDGNPGAGNVFKNIGSSFGMLCLLCDIFKGVIPIALCLHYLAWDNPLFGLVLAAPVLGHARKGKAIAVSFGVLLGLLPFSWMVLYLAVPFIFFSTLVRFNPHAWRVVIAFLCFILTVYVRVPIPALQLGALLVTITVVARHGIYIKSAHEKLRVDLGWNPGWLKRLFVKK